MKQISDADFNAVLRLLVSLSKRRGATIRENEDSRKASLMVKKLRRREGIV